MERKPVGKKAEPTQEELEFIYERLGRLSDQELLEEMQDTEFPLRSLGFIKRRRRENNAAKKVLQELIRKQIDPVIIKRKEQHFDHLADIAKALLSGNLANVTAKSTKTGDQFDIFEYSFWEGGAGQGITRKQLSDMLERNIESLSEQPNDAHDLDYFLYHLIAEYPEVKSKGFDKFAEENPYELIDILRLLVRRKTFEGTCPVCEGWR